jgi:hypothetical protein
MPEAVAGMAGGQQSSIAVTVTGAVYTWGGATDSSAMDRPRRAGAPRRGSCPALTADAVAMGRDFAFAIVPAG